MTKPWSDDRIDGLDKAVARLEAIHRQLVVGFIALTSAILVGFGALFALLATQG